MSSTPPPRYSTVQHTVELFELEEQSKTSNPMHHTAELEGSSTLQSPPGSATNSRNYADSAKRRPTPLKLGSEESPEISPQSERFGQSRQSMPYSQLSSLSPRSPSSSHSAAGRPSPTYPSVIAEDEPEFCCRLDNPSFGSP